MSPRPGLEDGPLDLESSTLTLRSPRLSRADPIGGETWKRKAEKQYRGKGWASVLPSLLGSLFLANFVLVVNPTRNLNFTVLRCT